MCLTLSGIGFAIVLGILRRRDEAFRRSVIETVLITMICTVIAAVLMPVSSGYPSNTRLRQYFACKDLALSFAMYIADNDNHGPLANWVGPVGKFHGRPIEYPKEGISLALNARLVGKDFLILEEPSETVMLFESGLPPGSIGTIMDAAVPQGDAKGVLAFADSHARSFARREYLGARWLPVFKAKR